MGLGSGALSQVSQPRVRSQRTASWPPRVLPPMAQPSPTRLAPPPHDHRLRDPARHARWRCGCPPARHSPNLTTTAQDPSVQAACEGAPGPCTAPAASAYPLEPRSRWATAHPHALCTSKPRESHPRPATTRTTQATRIPQHASSTWPPEHCPTRTHICSRLLHLLSACSGARSASGRASQEHRRRRAGPLQRDAL